MESVSSEGHGKHYCTESQVHSALAGPGTPLLPDGCVSCACDPVSAYTSRFIHVHTRTLTSPVSVLPSKTSSVHAASPPGERLAVIAIGAEEHVCLQYSHRRRVPISDDRRRKPTGEDLYTAAGQRIRHLAVVALVCCASVLIGRSRRQPLAAACAIDWPCRSRSQRTHPSFQPSNARPALHRILHRHVLRFCAASSGMCRLWLEAHVQSRGPVLRSW